MRKLYLTGALLVSALAVAGCNKAATTNNAAAPAAANTAAPAAPAGNSAAGGNNSAAAAPAGGEAQQNFSVVNNTGHTVVTLNVSATNTDSWGPDILGRDTLANGESAQITFPRTTTQCNWDIKATYDDGTNTDMRNVDLCTVATVTLTAS
jgi:hypothetical protein